MIARQVVPIEQPVDVVEEAVNISHRRSAETMSRTEDLLAQVVVKRIFVAFQHGHLDAFVLPQAVEGVETLDG